MIGADVAAIVRHEKQARLLNSWHIPALARSEVPAKRAQVVIDCTGTAQGFAEALELVEPRGTIILKSTYRGTPQADLTRIAVEEIRVIGSRCGPFGAALRLLDAGLVDVQVADRSPLFARRGLSKRSTTLRNQGRSKCCLT